MRSSTLNSVQTVGPVSSAVRCMQYLKEKASPWLTGNTASAAACASPAVPMTWPGWCANRKPNWSIRPRISRPGSSNACIIGAWAINAPISQTWLNQSPASLFLLDETVDRAQLGGVASPGASVPGSRSVHRRRFPVETGFCGLAGGKRTGQSGDCSLLPKGKSYLNINWPALTNPRKTHILYRNCMI